MKIDYSFDPFLELSLYLYNVLFNIFSILIGTNSPYIECSYLFPIPFPAIQMIPIKLLYNESNCYWLELQLFPIATLLTAWKPDSMND